MNKNSLSKSKNKRTFASIITVFLINLLVFSIYPVTHSLAAGLPNPGNQVKGPSSTWTTTEQNYWNIPLADPSPTPTKISGYLFDAQTKAPIPDIEIELTSNNASVVSRYVTTDATGYYEFVFSSEAEVYSSNTDLYLKGQLNISDPTYKTKYSVSYTDAGNYLDANNQEVHELVYIYTDRTKWNDLSQHQNFVLIPPLQVPLPAQINQAETPLLLVHGLGGGGNYWEGIRKLISTSGYSSQVWEILYPNDGSIIESADLVRDAVDTLLVNYDSDHQQVDMLAHSLGGPVSLAYIQGLARYPYTSPLVSYSPRVRKLLQLSPANHGSIHASRLIADAINGTTSCTTKLFNYLYTDDPLEPAYQDLALGSQFMQELFDSIDNSGLALDPSNVLVIAGTNSSILPTIQLLFSTTDCAPGQGQNDVFVSASSASLLNYAVPLGLVYLDHSETRGTNKITINNQTDYPEPPAQAQPLVDMIGNFFAGNTATVRNKLDLYIDPSSAPQDPTQYQVYQAGVLQSSPLGADLWNDGHSDTFFNAGSLWISALDAQGDPIPDPVWITDGTLYYKMYRSAADIFYIDSKGTVNASGTPVTRTETHYGEIAPAGSYGKTYSAFIRTSSTDISLGDVTISPVQTNYLKVNVLDCFSLSLTVDPASSGNLQADPAPNCAGGKYNYGTEVQLTADPNIGYDFTGWSGAVSGTTNPITLTMNGDKSVTAGFTQQCFSLTTNVDPAGYGSVEVNPGSNCAGGKYTYGTQVDLTAKSSALYIFGGWSGGGCSGTGTCTLTMTSDQSVTAAFKPGIVIYRQGAWLKYDFDSRDLVEGVWTGMPYGNCIPAPMDYNGDGVKDFTQLCNGAWFFYDDSGAMIHGIWVGDVAGQVPVPGNYTGSGKDDIVLFRNGAWLYYDYATGALTKGVWTGAPVFSGTPVPAPMDYTGDGKLDYTVYSGGPWFFFNADGSMNKGIWTGGVAGDMAVPGNYDGLGKDEIVIFRGGAWLFYDFTSGALTKGIWTGAPIFNGTPLPSPLDFTGDGHSDFTVFSGGPWFFFNSNGSMNTGIWTGGVSGDMPISNRYLP